MARVSVRRPIPALVFILALSLLTALVWYRVLHRSDAEGTSQPSGSRSCTTTTVAGTLPKPQQVRVTVLNSTQISGLAARAAGALKQRGFVIAGNVSDDPTAVTGVAQIRYGPKGAPSARLVAIYLPNAVLTPSPSTTTTIVTVSLGPQFSTLATQAQVTKALQSPSRTVKTCK